MWRWSLDNPRAVSRDVREKANNMDSKTSAMEFCRTIMHDYERQWTRAQGHAQRHPLRIKMLQLESMIDGALSDAEFEARLNAGASGDDWELGLLCTDLAPRWRAAREGQPFLDT